MQQQRDMIYEQTKELHKRDIPDFKNLFIEKAREISRYERDEYYISSDINAETIDLLEEYVIEFAKEGSYDIDKVVEYNTQFGKLHKWFLSNNKKWDLTKVWLYSLGRDINTESDEYSIQERLYILFLLVYGGELTKSLAEMSSGGVKLSRFLAVIMGVSSETTLKDPLINMKYLFDFSGLTDKEKTKFIKKGKDYVPLETEREKNGYPEAAKKFKRLSKIKHFMKEVGANTQIIKYIEEIEQDYKKYFG